MKLFDWLSGEYLRRKLASNPSYLQSVQFAQTYNPKSHTEYAWVSKMAIDEYCRMESHIEALERKADSLIKYLGASSGLIALYFSYQVPRIVIMPTLGLLFVALCLLFRAVQPEKITTPPHTREAFAYADAYPTGEAEASFAAMVGAAAVGLAIIITQKAKLMRGATALLLLAVFWLILSSGLKHPMVHFPGS